jgi:CubicO group peptidase (beta-lactamase class C family)
MKKHSSITKISLLFFIFIILILPLTKELQRKDSQKLDILDHRENFEQWLKDNHQAGIFPSISIAVVKKDKIFYSYFINSDFHKLYGLASITKTFTATGIMLLQEKHLINLDMKVKDVFPNLIIERPELDSVEVTLKHLITHTSGLPDLRYYKENNFIYIPDNDPAIQIPMQIYPAGKHYRYSNHGFIILGKVIEKYTELPLDRFMYKKIFNPLGMTDTKYSELYTGAYGLNSSLRDMIRYAMFFINEGYSPLTGHRILSSRTVRNMTDVQSENEKFICTEYCGLGWRAIKVKDHVITFFHIGGNVSIGAWIQIFPLQKMAVIYLSDPPEYNNLTMDFLFKLQSELSMMVSLESGVNYNIQSIVYPQVKPQNYGKYTGTFKNLLNNKTIVVYNKNEQLHIKDEDGRDYSLFPRSIYVFNGGYEYLTHQFIPEEINGKVVALARFDGYYVKVTE